MFPDGQYNPERASGSPGKSWPSSGCRLHCDLAAGKGVGRLGGQYGGIERDHILVQAPAHTHVKCPLLSPRCRRVSLSPFRAVSHRRKTTIAFYVTSRQSPCKKICLTPSLLAQRHASVTSVNPMTLHFFIKRQTIYIYIYTNYN